MASHVVCHRCGRRLVPRCKDAGEQTPQRTFVGSCTGCGQRLRFRAVAPTLQTIPKPVSQVTLRVNGELHVINNPGAGMSLLDWLEVQRGLHGSKRMCQEGGCGACVVAVSRKDPLSGHTVTRAVDSCLYPLCSLQDRDCITTTEGLGIKSKGFHPIQTSLAEHNGSQCGFCSPGMVMSMYSLLKQKPSATSQDIEDCFDGNICRCTGYRGILDAMQTFSDSASPVDIEESSKIQCVSCPANRVAFPEVPATPPYWFIPSTINDVFALLEKYKAAGVMVVAGGTGKGVFKDQPPVHAYVDIKGVADLYSVQVKNDALLIGSAVTLTRLIHALEDHQQADSKCQKFKKLANHIKKVANCPVRNVGTWAGNLMLTHDHDDFPSDLHTILTAAEACVFISSDAVEGNTGTAYSMADFLTLEMHGKLITCLSIPFETSTEQFMTYKVMPRHQNAHAYVNAGFSIKLQAKKNVVSSAIVAYGGIGNHTIRATATESYLKGKDMVNDTTLKGSLDQLSSEITPDDHPPAASVPYRKSLALCLFYKFYLSVLGDQVSHRLQSAAVEITRPVSSGQESFSTDPSKYPLTQPISKLAAKLQVSGEAEYVGDIPPENGELRGAFAFTSQANASIKSLTNISKALSMPGVVRIITSSDIAANGSNILTEMAPQLLFAEKESEYAGQPLLLVLADTQAHADAAARIVDAVYEPHGKPIVTLHEAINAQSFSPQDGTEAFKKGEPYEALKKSPHQISGEVSAGPQYHFAMETERCLAVPTEEGLTIHSPCRNASLCQDVVAGVTGLSACRVCIETRRCGGAFGGKFHSASHVAAGAGLAAQVMKRPVRIAVDLESNMQMFGIRTPVLAKYQVGFDDSGKINVIIATVYCGYGWTNAIESAASIMKTLDNAYNINNWYIIPQGCKLNTPAAQPCRSPVHFPAVFLIESIVDHVASALNKSPEDVRFVNLYQRNDICLSGRKLVYCNISHLWQALLQSCNFDQRKAAVLSFNKDNRWKKRSLAVVPLRYGLNWHNKYTVFVAIYADDGTVAITHGGSEFGQGANTKIAQVAAYELGIDIDLVSVRPANTFTSPNGKSDGGSTTTDLNCSACVNACKALNNRINPVREHMPKSTWQEIIKACSEKMIDLSAKSWVELPPNPTGQDQYEAYGVACSEVEIDVLTGEMQIERVDLLYDCGESMNPKIDIGQVQGAFVMGMGYLLTEHLIYDQDTGQLLTKNTWEYKPPSSQDIPIDFRISLEKNAPNPLGVLGAKAVGEPPICMTLSVFLAVRRAIECARSEIEDKSIVILDAPATPEVIQQSCNVNPKQLTL